MTPEELSARIALAEAMREATAAALDRAASNRALLAALEALTDQLRAERGETEPPQNARSQ
jgi:hypothetical protein